MRIAVCDDDTDHLKHIVNLVKMYKEEKLPELTYVVFSDEVLFLENVRKGSFDLVLLDVMMPQINGIEVAKEIREYDDQLAIIFLTSSPEFAVESYGVMALNYLLKPIKKEKLFMAMDKAYVNLKKNNEAFLVKVQGGVARVMFSKLTHVEVMNKTLIFYFSDGSKREIFATLAEFEDALLTRQEFIRTHRSFIVNLRHVGELHHNELITDTGKVVPISRRFYAQVKELYLEQLFIKDRQ